jgi:hypothetical protein
VFGLVPERRTIDVRDRSSIARKPVGGDHQRGRPGGAPAELVGACCEHRLDRAWHARHRDYDRGRRWQAAVERPMLDAEGAVTLAAERFDPSVRAAFVAFFQVAFAAAATDRHTTAEAMRRAAAARPGVVVEWRSCR